MLKKRPDPYIIFVGLAKYAKLMDLEHPTEQQILDILVKERQEMSEKSMRPIEWVAYLIEKIYGRDEARRFLAVGESKDSSVSSA